MPTETFANNATSTLSGSISSGVTALVVADGSKYPAAGQFRIKINNELMLVSSRSGNNLTVARGQEGTTAATHTNGDAVVHIVTAGAIEQLKADVQALNKAGTPADSDFLTTPSPGKLAIDTGTGQLYYRTEAVDTWAPVIHARSTFVNLPVATLQFTTALAAPAVKQADNTTNAATAQALTIQAQNATGTTSTGGGLVLTSGTGTSAAGNVSVQVGGVTKILATPTALTFSNATAQFATGIGATGVFGIASTNSGNGQNLEVAAQTSTAGSSTGGDLLLQSGAGTTAPGKVRLRYGTTDAFVVESGLLTVLVPETVNGSRTSGDTRSREDELTTTDNSTQPLLTVVIPTDAGLVLDVEVVGVEDGAVGMRWFKKSMAFLNTAGTVTNGTVRDVDSETIGTPTNAWAVTMDSNAGNARVQVNGGGAAAVKWYVVSQRVRVTHA